MSGNGSMSTTQQFNLPFVHSHRLGRQRPVFLVGLGSGALAASLLILKFAPTPFFWVGLIWVAALWVAMLGFTGWPRAILLNLGIIVCMLAGVEAYLSVDAYTPPIFSDGFIVHDDILGWAPAKGIRAHASKSGPAGLLHGPKGVLFNVDYTIDSDGLRVPPPSHTDDLAGAVLFFGCSFTFGEGLKDAETLPYQVGLLTQGRYRIYNFGFEGYGPNQMLAAIENGIVDRKVEEVPRFAYYVAIPNHVWRVAGRVAWGNHAPRYVLDPDGGAHFAGHFENRIPLAERMGIHRGVGQLQKSALWRVLDSSDLRITDDDIHLYFAVVRRSKELLEARYPGIQFRVILWPNQLVAQQQAAYLKLQEGFRQMGISVDLVENILPGYKVDRSPYILGEADHHPNALADRLIAQHAAKEISTSIGN